MAGCDNLNEAAVERILNAVGTVHIPYDLDKLALIRCLDLCSRRYRDAVRFRSSRNEKAAFRQLEQTRKAAKRLETLLVSAEVGEWSVTRTPDQPLTYRD